MEENGSGGAGVWARGINESLLPVVNICSGRHAAMQPLMQPLMQNKESKRNLARQLRTPAAV
jgi:hypothetical protein